MHCLWRPANPSSAGSFRALRLFGLLQMALLVTAAYAQGPATTWELRVCADPGTLPFSNSQELGFENRIAEIVADELGAELTYDWSPFTRDLIDRRFGEGACDVIMGVPDGFEQGLNTISYYQSPYVMVYRADAGLDISSLDDPDLLGLDLAVQGLGTPPHEALRQRDMLGQVTQVFGGEQGDEHLAVLVRAVEEGTVDVGFGWGPVVGYYAMRSPVELVVRPVEPAFDLPSIIQSVPMTMAVRRDDVALRDLLNVAISRRWHDIQAVLADFDVTVLEQPAPFLGERPADLVPTLQLGVILPMPTGARTMVAGNYTIAADAARMGALLAEGSINAEADQRGLDVYLLLANAPDAASARRAAQRLVTVHGAQALVGGVAAGQAEELAEVATEHGVPFLNVGSTSQLLRAACYPTTFHVQPSATTYMAAMIATYRAEQPGAQRWYVVAEEGAEGNALLASAEHLLVAQGDTLVGSRLVIPERPVYFDLFSEIEAGAVDAVMVLLGPVDQLTFIGQAQDAGLDALLAPFPDPITQTRDFLAASARYGVGVDVPRLMLWEAAIDEGVGGDLNRLFMARFGQPFDALGWATWRAVRLLADTAARVGAEAGALNAALAAGSNESGPFGADSFGPDHELDQALWLARPEQDAVWGVTVSQRLGTATLLGQAPRGPQLPAATCH